ncbi:MAG: nicotinate-nucleotide--dimethylbenzimidazole phosphoribosyltransferase [Bacteroides sp.]|nr:nicotinate-nucleotide--dimethylbenzimidazole phosphoribosyltransferase [Eubacterium sp.]MCM1417858.1 nicotinate-nucleotide--dimethylbenzimidazole phosphoribosyltransferase [Roseburia sp.]MCM1461297.1 nicotinate-nucleotide--dimethylbenzimidazole phosphoribosyltransferase [Bacteroides sp.]
MDRLIRIKHADRAAYRAAKERWDSVAKPLGSLGLLEEAIQRIASIQASADIKLDRRTVVVLCADNGVTAEGIAQSDSAVTAICAKGIAEGTSNINALASVYGADVIAVDLGIARDVDHTKLLDKKIAYGTGNIALGAAMTREEAKTSVSVGIDLIRDLKSAGTRIVITGEMGIGNTTTSAAVAAVLLDADPRLVTGRGAGLSGAGLERKIAVVKRAIALNRPDPDDPIDVLSKLGGFDIGGMTGLYLGGAIYGVPVVIDGVISAVAALLAYRLAPIAAEYMLASHMSDEPAAKMLLQKIGLKPPIRAGLRLGEGTGGVLLLPLLDGALAVYQNAHQFDEVGIERYQELK